MSNKFTFEQVFLTIKKSDQKIINISSLTIKNKIQLVCIEVRVLNSLNLIYIFEVSVFNFNIRDILSADDLHLGSKIPLLNEVR